MISKAVLLPRFASLARRSSLRAADSRRERRTNESTLRVEASKKKSDAVDGLLETVTWIPVSCNPRGTRYRPVSIEGPSDIEARTATCAAAVTSWRLSTWRPNRPAPSDEGEPASKRPPHEDERSSA